MCFITRQKDDLDRQKDDLDRQKKLLIEFTAKINGLHRYKKEDFYIKVSRNINLYVTPNRYIIHSCAQAQNI